MTNQPVLRGPDNKTQNIGEAIGKEEIKPSHQNCKNQGEPHDNSDEIHNHEKENPPEMEISSQDKLNYVKENPPDVIQWKSTELEEAETINLRISKRSHGEDPIESKIQAPEDNQAFVYELNGELLVFQCMSDNYTMQCPKCKTETRYIIQHMTKNPTCQTYVNPNEFKLQFNMYKSEKVRKDNAQRKKASRAKLKAENNEAVKRQHRNHQASSMVKLRAENNERVKQEQKKRKLTSMAKQRAENNEKVKEEQTKQKLTSMVKQRAEDNEKVKQEQTKWKLTSMAKQRAEDEKGVKKNQVD